MARLVRELRDLTGLTQEKFAAKLGVTFPTINRWENDRAKPIIDAMESIEADYENPRGVLPKSEYQELDNAVLGQLLRTLNPEELKRVSGDVFGRALLRPKPATSSCPN